jgi:aspartate aminotransferase
VRVAEWVNRLGGQGMGDVLAQVGQLRAQGKRIISLHAGEPDFDTPGEIVETAIAALRSGQTHYTPALGIPVLRQAIAEEVSRTRRIPVDPEQVIVVPGAKPMIYFAVLALCQPGDEVICPDPGYPFYASLARFVGAKPVSLPMTMETGFSFDADCLRDLVTPRTRLIVLNSPSNPTGNVLERSDLEAVAEVALTRDIFVLSDEIYSRIVYDSPFQSIASIPGMAEHTIIVDGFSKTYAMTGWRLGYGVMPRELVPHIFKLILNTLSCTAAFSQSAGVEALRGSQEAVHRMVRIFLRRRGQMVEGLNRIPGLVCLEPKGAFYAFPKVNDVGMSSLQLTHYLLTEAGVATYPGSAFGSHGEGFLRLSFACSEQDIDEGLRRIADALSKL